ncbi:MAG TPA: Cd(II)/Pb(II)-responsive transcriptional regulator [Burkholderiaceae bacterium]
MKIGDLATSTDTPVETIRYYEREGLMSAPARSSGNFRLYDEGHVRRLGFIRACRALDMNLGEIRVLLRFRDGGESDCGEVNALLDEHLEHVEERMRELRRLAKDLRALRDECRKASPTDQCGILRGLDRGAFEAPAKTKSHVGHVHRKGGKS